VNKLEQLIRWYIQNYGYTRALAIASIKAELDWRSKGVILKGGSNAQQDNVC